MNVTGLSLTLASLQKGISCTILYDTAGTIVRARESTSEMKGRSTGPKDNAALLERKVKGLLQTFMPEHNLERALRENPNAIKCVMDTYALGILPALLFFNDVEVVSSTDKSTEIPLGGHLMFGIFYSEAIMLSGRSMYLALHGAQNASLSLLRGVVDLSTQGAVMDHLINHREEVVANKNLWTENFAKWASSSGMDQRLERLKTKIRWQDRDPYAECFELIGSDLRGIGLADASDQLVTWKIASPIPDPYNYVRYQDLNENAHLNLKRGDLFRLLTNSFDGALKSSPSKDLQEETADALWDTATSSKDGDARLPIDPKELNDYATHLARVMDFHGVLTVNTLSDLIRSNQSAKDAAAEFLENVMAHSQTANFEYSRQATEAILRDIH